MCTLVCVRVEKSCEMEAMLNVKGKEIRRKILLFLSFYFFIWKCLAVLNAKRAKIETPKLLACWKGEKVNSFKI